ncbi:TSL-kinase interacting protein 1-like protein [Drosera capensis]
MKTIKLQKERPVAATRNQNMGKASTGVNRSTMHKFPGAVGRFCCKSLCPGTKETSSAFQHDQVATRLPPPKMRLQLFPLDEAVRRGLEQDGHSPYLELTLRPSKQISSVLNRIRNKWGGSSIAIGEPILFPYMVSVENLSNSTCWTLNHRGITTGYVYKAVGSPKTFRLRSKYGWFTLQPSKYCPPPSSTSFRAPENPDKVHSSLYETTNSCQGTLSEFNSINASKPTNASEAAYAAPVDQACSSETLDDEEPSTENPLQQISFMWSDCLPNISVGGLFSEASLQELIRLTDPKSKGGRADSQLNQLIADSLDAFISDLSKNPSDQRNVSRGPSLIFDDPNAACDPFTFKEPASSAYYHPQMEGSSSAAASNHDVGTKLCDIPQEIEEDVLGNSTYPERETGTASGAGIFNDDRSIGLSGIRWNDSLGPFDLALPY